MNSDHPYNKALHKLIEDSNNNYYSQMTVENLDAPSLFVPDVDAIENQAHYYFQKYEIVIRLVNTYDLCELLKEFNEKITSPFYVGVIATPDNLNESKTRFGHAVPLLLYFSGNHRINEIECISLDAITSIQMNRIYSELNAFGIPPSQIYLSTHPRQADDLSCHTDALVVLRNALLSLKYHNYKDGFKTALQAGKLNEHNDKIISLPSEWDYTSQIYHHDSLTRQIAIRSLYSKKSQTVEEHRQKHTETHKHKYTYFSSLLGKITVAPPQEFTLKNEGSIVFTVDTTINTYLLGKGHRMEKKASERAQKFL